jgi:putative peptide zinc metalloprotease protein
MAVTDAPLSESPLWQSALWQRLSGLRPQLPQHIAIQPRDYQHERWYLLHDKSTGKFHRLTPSAYQLICLMNGRNSLAQILAAVSGNETNTSNRNTHKTENKTPAIKHKTTEIKTTETEHTFAELENKTDAPTAAEIIHLIQYLHVADLLVCDMPPNTQELFARQQQLKKQTWLRFLTNPFVWKFSLGNPDKLLTHLLPLARLMASPAMGIIWLIVVGYAVLQAGNHWTELTRGQMVKILSPSNLLLLWLIYPLLKTLHELGHGLFTKVWGGNVQEWGLMVILATPLPFVDATAATGFKSKKKRMVVSAAGMAVELFIAALALLLWINLEEGLLRDILFNIMIIGGVSTLFFNGNPLMRYDGYYLLSDALDLPNLATRANHQCSYVVRRYLYGLQGLVAPATSLKEASFFCLYSLAAFIYRLIILATIILLIAHYFPKLALFFALWLISFQLLVPGFRYFKQLATNAQIQPVRKRVYGLLAAGACLVLVFLWVVPVPMSTTAEGVIWLPEDAQIKSAAAGEIARVLAVEGETVQTGQVLLELSNPTLLAQLAYQKSYLREYNARLEQAWADDRGAANRIEQDINAIKAEVENLQLQVDHLLIRSPGTGKLRMSHPHELMGSFLHQGDLIGIIAMPEQIRVRTALTQEEIGLVQASTQAAEVRLRSNPSQGLAAKVSQAAPSATFELPSAALGAKGGGRITVDGSKSQGTKTTAMVFLVDLTLVGLIQYDYFGERAYVRFYHRPEPLGFRLFRQLQQLFIRSFEQSF